MGQDFYAAIAWPEPRDALGRPVWIGWLGNHGYQGRLPRQGWRGAMSLPRRLSLRRTDKGLVLRQEAEPAAVTGVPMADPAAASMPLAAQLDLPGRRDFALTLGDHEGRLLLIERQGTLLTMTRRDPVSTFLDSAQTIRIAGDSPLALWLDHGSAELFGDDGQLCATMQHRMAGTELSMRLKLGATA
jgi:sucrose-6-phosphate hydrolase SacC (GH32 family)